MRKEIFVCDIALASILDAYGIPKRQYDPVTREIRVRDGREVETGKWWYDIADPDIEAKCRDLMDAYNKARNWEQFTLDAEHPLYWMKGVLENRNANLHLLKNGAVPMRVIEHGEKTIIFGPRVSHENKEKLKSLL